METYPEHDKLAKVKERSQEIGEFLEWLDSKHLLICAWSEGAILPDLYPVSETHTKLLAKYFEIDMERLEAEKRSMLETLRWENDNDG